MRIRGEARAVVGLLVLVGIVVGVRLWCTVVQAGVYYKHVAAPRLAPVLEGAVYRVVDGDTFDVVANSDTLRVRVSAIDAPEHDQPWGGMATAEGRALLQGKRVTLAVVTRDRYGRVVASVGLPDGRDYGAAMVSQGLAWWYREYSGRHGDYAALEAAARAARAGLWVQPGAVPPWVWRAQKRR